MPKKMQSRRRERKIRTWNFGFLQLHVDGSGSCRSVRRRRRVHLSKRFRPGQTHVPHRLSNDLPDRLQEGVPEFGRASK